jgi:hypothetical protein
MMFFNYPCYLFLASLNGAFSSAHQEQHHEWKLVLKFHDVTANTEPANGCAGCSFLESQYLEVVTYKMSKSGPPNIMEETHETGIFTLLIKVSVLGLTLLAYKEKTV